MAEDVLTLYQPEEAWDALMTRRRLYYNQYTAAYGGEHKQLAATAEPGSFWKRGGKAKMHVPVAADIAATSANLLFGEEPRFTIYDDSLGDTEQGSQQRLEQIIAESGLGQKLHEAAENGAVAGDVFLKCRYDHDRMDMPSITVVRGHDALAEYQFDTLIGIHFFTVLKVDTKSGKIWRVYECYQPGSIMTMVYRGDSGTLGTQDLSTLAQLGIEPEVKTPVDMMLAAHIVNMKPSRVWDTDEKGRSDFEGLRDLMDSLDEVYSSWMRDIRLAKSRLIVPAEFLRRNPSDMFKEGHFTYDFDEDVETLVALDIGGDGVEQKITPSQFQIRAEEHAATYESTLRTIISMAGYSPQTFGLDIQGNAQSGTARRIMERKSLATNAKKQAYWKKPLQAFMTAVMHLDKAVYGNENLHDDDSVRVELKDPVVTDPQELASAVNLLNAASAASIETLVKMLHPDWGEKTVKEELDRIRQEHGVPDVTPRVDLGDHH